MNARTKNSVHTTVIIVTVAIVMVIARQGFAWTNPDSNPPLATPLISTLGGNVGIGTATPGAKLDVNGTSNFMGKMTLPTSGGTNYIGAGTGDGASYTTYNFTLKGWQGMALKSYDDSVHGVYNFRTGDWKTDGIISLGGAGNNYFAGNVGIGTTAPAAKLSVGGTGTAGTGIYSNASNYGGYFSASTGIGVLGVTGPSISLNYGGYFWSPTGTGAYGEGVTGVSANGYNIGVYANGGNTGVYAVGDLYGGYFVTPTGNGVYGNGNIGVYANGFNIGVYAIGTNNDYTGGHGEKSVGGVWTNAASYRKWKENFLSTDGYLDKLVNLDVYEWQYKNEVMDGQNRYTSDPYRHASPFLDDFYNTFHLGTSDGYNIQDLAGVAISSIKELYKKFTTRNEEVDKKFQEQAKQIEELKAEIQSIKR